MAKRTGAGRRADIPCGVLDRLNSGELETATLAEALAVDFAALLATVTELSNVDADALGPSAPFVRRMQSAGAVVAALPLRRVRELRSHRSDTVRGWAGYALVDRGARRPLHELLDELRPLADDAHFGVREWAWLAVRRRIVSEPLAAIAHLAKWTAEESPNLRRFASEATRPRGVWSVHITLLRDQPELGLPILEPLRADPARHVQDSVANWLNDAGKSRADWLRAVLARWRRESPGEATQRICQRAGRSLS